MQLYKKLQIELLNITKHGVELYFLIINNSSKT